MHSLLRHIADSDSGAGELNIKSHLTDVVINLPKIFACPMIAREHFDLISGYDSSDRMEAGKEFITTKFYLKNCTVLNDIEIAKVNTTFRKIAEGCPRFQKGSSCWAELTAELSRGSER